MLRYIRRQLSDLDEWLHSIISPWFYGRYRMMAYFFGSFVCVRKWIGGSWCYYYDDDPHAAFWMCFKGSYFFTRADYPPMMRGTPHIERHVTR